MYNLAITKIAVDDTYLERELVSKEDPSGRWGWGVADGTETGHRKVWALGCGYVGPHQGEIFGNFSIPVTSQIN